MLPEKEAMTEVQELLQNRAEEEEEERNDLYYTDKQVRVIEAIVENPTKNTKEIGEIAGVHPSYITYIIQRLPPEHATDFDWLRERAGLDEEGEPEEVEVEDEEVEEEESEGVERLVEEFGGAEGLEDIEAGEIAETANGGLTLSVTKSIPMKLTVSIPEEVLQGEAMEMLHAAAKEKPEA